MKEEMLQNDTEDVIDLTEDEWKDLGKEKTSENIRSWIDSHIRHLSVLLPIVSAALLILIMLIIGLSRKKTDTTKVKESYVSSSLRQETETEEEATKPSEMTTGQPDTGGQTAQPHASASKETENTAALIEEAEKKYQSLHDMIFGESSQSGSLGCVTAVTGFTDREKREVGFLESDFLKDAGAFLAGQQIQTKRIIIEDRIASSSDAGIAFQGRLEGKDDYILDMVFYPDLPGEYVFLLRNLKGNERETEDSSSNRTSQPAAQETEQAANQTQNNQTAAPVQNNNQTVVVPQSTESIAQPQNSYDATNLSVKKNPETLLNYLDNRYEFQYSLYDWLYNHGKKEVGSASVTGYSIDGDARQAVIELQLSDGSGVTAVYDKTDNSYSFER